MKRAFLLTIMVMVALYGAASDRFYIEDFSFATIDTTTVNLVLDNETPFTAFQFDIYMPDGLTIVPGSVALTDRVASDHTLTVNEIAEGVYRLMSYSLGINTFAGNSGALVTLDVAATNDFVGTATITLRKVLFTAATGVEVPLGDEFCTVTVTSEGLIGDVDEDGFVSISDVTDLIDYLLSGMVSPFNLGNADVSGDGDISISDVTDLIDYLMSND